MNPIYYYLYTFTADYLQQVIVALGQYEGVYFLLVLVGLGSSSQ